MYSITLPRNCDSLHALMRKGEADKFRFDVPVDQDLAPASRTVSLSRYAEPLVKERGGNPNGELWHLKSLLGDMREGHVGTARKPFLWNKGQVEALWDNIANGWPIGRIVAVDLTGCHQGWEDRFGPYQTSFGGGKRVLILAGAEKLAVLAWSLSEPPTALQQRTAPDETALWAQNTLVADAQLRRIRFVPGEPDPKHHLPVRLLPDTVPYLMALNEMSLSPLEREWLNRTARRLLEAQVNVHFFSNIERAAADRLISNLRIID